MTPPSTFPVPNGNRLEDGVTLHWSVDELGSRAGLTRTLGHERLKDTSLDYSERARMRRQRLDPRIPLR